MKHLYTLHAHDQAIRKLDKGKMEIGAGVEAIGQSLQDSLNRNIHKSSTALLFLSRYRFL